MIDMHRHTFDITSGVSEKLGDFAAVHAFGNRFDLSSTVKKWKKHRKSFSFMRIYTSVHHTPSRSTSKVHNLPTLAQEYANLIDWLTFLVNLLFEFVDDNVTCEEKAEKGESWIGKSKHA